MQEISGFNAISPTHFSSFHQDSQLIDGVAFKKTFSYAGFEMQPKKYKDPKIALLNIELELKSEKDNAEIRLDNVAVSVKKSFHCLTLHILLTR